MKPTTEMVSPTLISATFQAFMRVSGASSISHFRSLRLGTTALASKALPSTGADCAGTGTLRQVGRHLQPGGHFQLQFGVRVLPSGPGNAAFKVDRPVLVKAAPAMMRTRQQGQAQCGCRQRGEHEFTSFHD
jgi:hypothetical protein